MHEGALYQKALNFLKSEFQITFPKQLGILLNFFNHWDFLIFIE